MAEVSKPDFETGEPRSILSMHLHARGIRKYQLTPVAWAGEAACWLCWESSRVCQTSASKRSLLQVLVEAQARARAPQRRQRRPPDED